MRSRTRLLSAAAVAAAISSSALAGTWTPIKNRPPFQLGAAEHLLLTDGSVICQNSEKNLWAKLTPDKYGSYVNGTWTTIAPFPSDYGPLWYASAVLPSGNVFVMGGEYNLNDNGGNPVFTNRGEYYNTLTNTWSPITPPDNGAVPWDQVGDAQCVILPSGRLLLASIEGTAMAAFNEKTLDFTDVSASGKADGNDEEGWTLLPDGTILVVDASNAPNVERYIPSSDTSGKWINAGNTGNSLADKASDELGPTVLRYDGTVFAMGATKYTAIYTPPKTLTGTGTWTAGPTFPVVNGQQMDIADGPACLLPNNNVLCAMSPGVFQPGLQFFEFDGTKFIPEPDVPNASGDGSFEMTLLMLPNGQVMCTDLFDEDVEFYTSTGTPKAAWRPVVTSISSKLVAGAKNVKIEGTQLNGLSQCVAYGDDFQAAVNFPIVRLTNPTTGHVFYCRTHDPSSMGVATGSKTVSVLVDVPSDVEAGATKIEVVAGGISSGPVAVQRQVVNAISVGKMEGSSAQGTLADISANDATSFNIDSIYENGVGEVASGIVIFQAPPQKDQGGSYVLNYVLASQTGVTNSVFLWNWNANRWDFFSTGQMTSNFSSGSLTLTPAQATPYLNSSRQMRVLFRDIAPQHVTNQPSPFTLRLNQVVLLQ